jgi:hypothetical protein
MRQAGESDHGLRLCALIVVLWRAGLRIGEAMALTEPDLEPGRGSLLVRRARAADAGRSGWTTGVRAAPALARPPGRDAGRDAVLRHRRPDARKTLDTVRRSQPAPPHRCEGRRPPPLRPAPASPRTCCRDGRRERAAERDSAPARPRQPWCHLGLLDGIDTAEIIEHRPQPATTQDLCQRGAADLRLDDH